MSTGRLPSNHVLMAVDYANLNPPLGPQSFSMNEVTRILAAIQGGNAAASDELLPLVYDELRKLAASKLAREQPGMTLQATALVHEAYMRLVEDQCLKWNSRGHFFAAAAEAMRRILVECARHKRSLRAGGNYRRQEMPEIVVAEVESKIDLLALNDALAKLEQEDPRRAELVKLRFFAGLTIAEAAESLGIATSTADSDWAYARAWLRVEMEG